jgi:threonine dehydrogenase-like Zn-dependent dehydrogenase
MIEAEVRYCGICGSDLPVYRWEGQPAKWSTHLPRVMGHEFAGTIEALGAGVGHASVRVGDKVAVEPGVTCGTCAGCRQGYGNLCERRSIVGIDTDGAFAQLVSVPAANVFRLDPDADLRRAAFLEVFALGLHCVERARLLPSHRVLVLGAGPVGLSAVAIARLAGCDEVVAAGAPQDVAVRLPIAAELGATQTVLSTDLPELGEFDVVVEASGAAPAIRSGIAACRIGGRVVAVGTSPGDVAVDWSDVVMRAIRIVPVRARLDRHWTDGARLLERIPLPDTFFELFPLARISDAFDTALGGGAVKVLIDPGADPSDPGPASGGEAEA